MNQNQSPKSETPSAVLRIRLEADYPCEDVRKSITAWGGYCEFRPMDEPRDGGYVLAKEFGVYYEDEPAVASSDLLGAMYRGSDGAMTCALCNCEMEWGECGDCGGEGGHDGYEEDPLWYQPGEISPCGMCNGKGGEWYCETKDCPTGSGWKVIPAPQAPNDDFRRPPQ